MTGADVTIPGVEGATEIGRGGFGVVYRATEADLGRDVAVKVLSGELDERTRSRFERERRAMGTLSSHPNIITIFRSGTAENGSLYLVMEYLPGGSLAEHIAETGPTGWEDTLRIGVELCGALESAHRAGVLHRDVKPGNIMMDTLGRSKLGDFGIARLDGSPETKSAVITASVAHAPPEVIAGDKPDERSDVYSLASTLFELASGTPAFVRPTDESMIPMFARIVHEPAPDLRHRGIPDAVATVMETAMAKKAEYRYPSAAEFGRALIAVQRQLGVSETRLWIEGEPAPEMPTGQHTQIVPPPGTGASSPQTGPAMLPPPQPTAPGQAYPQGPGYQQQPQPSGSQPVAPGPPPPTQPTPQSQQVNPAAQAGPAPQQFAAPPNTGPATYPGPSGAGPLSTGSMQPPTGYVPPPGQGGYAPGQQAQVHNQAQGYNQAQVPGSAPQGGAPAQSSRVGLIIATVLGAFVVLLGGIALLTRRDDDPETAQTVVDTSDTVETGSGSTTTTTTTARPTTTTTVTTTTTAAPPETLPPRVPLLADLPELPSFQLPYTDFKAVGDNESAFSVQVPTEWVDELPTEGQVIVSPDNNAALADEAISGLVVSGSQGVGAWDADFFLDELLAGLADPDAPCSPVKREPYDDGFFDGLIYAELCGDGQLLVVDLLVANPDRDAVIFIGMQMTDERDMAAFEKVLETFRLADPARLPPVS